MSAPLCRNCCTRPDDHTANVCPTKARVGIYEAMTSEELMHYSGTGAIPDGGAVSPQHELLAFMVTLNFGSKVFVAQRVQDAALAGTLEPRLRGTLRDYEGSAGGRWLPCSNGEPSTSPIEGVEARFVPT